VQQDQRVFQIRNHLLGVGHEIGRQVATVELHPLDDFDLGLHPLVLFDGDDTLVADLLHRVGDLAADERLAVRRDGADLGHFVAVLDRTRRSLDRRDDLGGGQVDAALQVHRVHARCNRLQAFLDDGLRQHGGGGGAVAGLVIGAGSDFLHHLGAHVLELVFQFDFLGDRDTVLGDARGTERFLDDDVTAFRAERHLDSIREDVDAAQHTVAGIGIELDFLGSHWICSWLSWGYGEKSGPSHQPGAGLRPAGHARQPNPRALRTGCRGCRFPS